MSNKKKIQITYSELNSGIVTGSNHYLEIKVNNKTTNIMLDMGAIQSGRLTLKQSFATNKVTRDMSDIDHLLISHNHLDHHMGMAQLMRLDFNGIIYMTELTSNISQHISADGIKIHEANVETLKKYGQKKGVHVEPYMNTKSREWAMDRVRGYGYNDWITLEDGIRAKFIPNGHVSGSASIVIEVVDGYEKETILYMSDTSCNRDIPFTMPLDIEKMKINTAIIESTYGNVHIPQRSEKEMVEDLYKIIKETCLDDNAKVLIPAFANARATNLLYYIKKTYDKYPELNKIPIKMVSPLMNKCHNEISKGKDFYSDKWKNEMDLFRWDIVQHISDGKMIEKVSKSPESCVIIASSGMGDAGVNARLLPETIKGRKNTIVFCGYCAENTTGYKILQGKQKTITSNIDGEKKTVYIKANIVNLTGLSSHASGKEIIESLMTAEKKKMRNVIIIHGDSKSDRVTGLRDMVKKAYSNPVSVYIPKENQKIKLT